MIDSSQRFSFEKLPIRGDLVDVSQSYKQVLSKREYPGKVQTWLGEMLAAVALLSNTVKMQGTLALQANGEGALRLLMAEATIEPGKTTQLRAIARLNEDLPQPELPHIEHWLGQANLVITITPHQGKRYQGIVQLQNHSLAASFGTYFQQSEQLPTQLVLGADGTRARGLLLQQLPNADKQETQEHWQTVTSLTSTLGSLELLQTDNTELLHRLYHEFDLRLYTRQHYEFGCTCSRARVEQTLISLGKDEALSMVLEQGDLAIDCQFCHQLYKFSPQQVADVFTD